jgi:hypothetical protein
MKKEDINSELISKMEIKVEETLFYMPGETIKGKIIINPKYKMKDKIFHITLKLIQYEFWEYNNIEIEELKNIYKTVIKEEKIDYKLNELELSKKESSDSFENFSIIEKEEDKIISIPFNFKINEDNILPTFQFQNKDYILGIRHLLIAECEEFNSSNYTGLFIGKNKKIELCEPKEIKENYRVGLGNLEIKLKCPKLSFNSDEEISLDIETNADLNFKRVTEVKDTFYRKINWVGYLKNSNIHRKIYGEKTLKYNEYKSLLVERIVFPIYPVATSLGFGLLFGLSNYKIKFGYGIIEDFVVATICGIRDAAIGLLCGFFLGLREQGKVAKDALNLNDNLSYLKNDFKKKFSINEEQESLLIEELKKFVFFKDNKIVGFIKFENDITPPVNGYYFNCEFNTKIEVEIAGIILNRNKYLKTQIDLYDSDEYIAKMKEAFKIN